MMKGTELGIGQSARVLEILEDIYALRFIELGIRPGTLIQVLRKAPFNGAIYVRTDRGAFALRADELAHLRLG